MKSIHLTSTLCAALVALHGIAFAGGEGWSSDYEAAKKQAAESKKDLLLDFTGPDVHGSSVKLEKEIFSLDPFNDGVKDKLVLVKIDFAQDQSKLPEETQAQYKELAGKYAVKSLPAILLCDAEGRPYASTTYKEGGPKKYVAHLDELRGNKAKRDEALATAEKAEGVAKAKALLTALNVMKLDDKLVTNFYGDITDQIKTADPKDETGFGKKLAAKTDGDIVSEMIIRLGEFPRDGIDHNEYEPAQIDRLWDPLKAAYSIGEVKLKIVPKINLPPADPWKYGK